MDRSKRGTLTWAGRGLLAAGLLPLAACGFKPLYSQNDQGQTVNTKLAAVRIEPLRDRVGQQMHNLLRDRLNPNGQPVAPEYRLQVQITETRRELGVRRDETATRANLKLDTFFFLTSAESGEQVLSGRSTSTTSYDILEEPFATTISERNARERALREVADDIQTRLAVFFSDT